MRHIFILRSITKYLKLNDIHTFILLVYINTRSATARPCDVTKEVPIKKYYFIANIIIIVLLIVFLI